MSLFYEYLKKNSISQKDLFDFTEQVFIQELQKDEEFSANAGNKYFSYRAINRPGGANGNFRVRSWRKKSITITINIHQFYREKGCSPQMKYVLLYAVIVHELEHGHLYRLIRGKGKPNYPELIAAWDQIWCSREGKNDIWNRILMHGGKIQKRYDSSPAEIYCNYVGIKRAYEILKDDLANDIREEVKEIIEGLSLMVATQEIRFYGESTAVQLFPTTIKQMQMLYYGKRNYSDKFPIVEWMFADDGSLYSAEEMMNRMQETNENLYMQVLIRMFIYLHFDWKPCFEKNQKLKGLMSELSDSYCKSAIRFLLNQDKTEIFLPHEIVQENTETLTRNICILKEQMKRYGMESVVGGVFPLYHY